MIARRNERERRQELGKRWDLESIIQTYKEVWGRESKKWKRGEILHF